MEAYASSGKIMRLVNTFRKTVSPLRRNCFVVAGLPRCGTTLACTALTRRKLSTYRAPGFLIEFPDGFRGKGGFVYKTHTPYPPEHVATTTKILFMFGDPRDAVISIYNNLGYDQAYRNAHSPYRDEHERLFERDLMGLEANFENWYRHHSYSFASVRYEAFYNRRILKVLEEYLGMRLSFPPARRRRTNFRLHPEIQKINSTYAGLLEKVSRAKDVQIWEPLDNLR
jgi:hypothetical protein